MIYIVYTYTTFGLILKALDLKFVYNISSIFEFNKIPISFRKLHNQESQLYSWGGLRDHSGLFETCLQGQGSKLQKWLNKRARKMGVNHLKDKQNITLFVTQPNRAEKKKWQLSYQISLVSMQIKASEQ